MVIIHSRYRARNWLPVGLVLLFLMIPRIGRAASADQYLFLNRTPGLSFDQNRPETIADALFTEPRERLQTTGTPTLRLGVSFVLSYLNGPPDKVEATLKRLLEMSEKHETPVLIVLDGENWWDPKRGGYDPRNLDNVEWEAACNQTLGFQRCRLLSLQLGRHSGQPRSRGGARRTLLNRPTPNNETILDIGTIT